MQFPKDFALSSSAETGPPRVRGPRRRGNDGLTPKLKRVCPDILFIAGKFLPKYLILCGTVALSYNLLPSDVVM